MIIRMHLHPNGFAIASYVDNQQYDRRFLLKKFAFLAAFAIFLACSNFVAAQQADAMLGFGTVMSPSAASCGASGFANYVCPEKGGLYPNISADVIFHRRVGIGFDASWRASQGNFAGVGVPYRPILFDINAVYQPRLSKKAGLDLMGGIGWQDTRFYSSNYNCSFVSCTNYTSSNHFLVDLGAGVRYYVWGHVFLRPEAHYYHVLNNTDFFSSGNIIRVGASIGYTIGPE